jgi:hypothetical protein
MSNTIGSGTPIAAALSLQKTAQEIPKALVQQLLPQPIRQTSGKDSATFSSEALALLQAVEKSGFTSPQ